MYFKNLTPHTLNIVKTGGGVLVLPASGDVARVEVQRTTSGTVDVCGLGRVQINKRTFGDIVGLPAPELDAVSGRCPTVFFIVSGMVHSALAGSRPDVFTVGELVRDEGGNVVGCNGLVR